MTKLRLTDKYVASAKATTGERLEVFDQDVRGLILRVTPAGKKSWVFRYRTADGMQRRHALGVYLSDFRADVELDDEDKDGKQQALTLSQARAAARDLINNVGKGHDPSAQRDGRVARAKAEPIKTMNDLKDAYFTAVEIGEWRPREKVKKASTVHRERQMWDTYIAKRFGTVRVEDVSSDSIKQVLRAIVAKGNGTTSNRVRALLRQIMNFAVSEDRIAINPVSKVKALSAEKSRERVLSDAEVKAIWQVLNDTTGLRVPAIAKGKEDQPLYVGEPVRIALKLLLITMTRRSEVAGMRLDEIDFDQATWIIPGTRTKNGKPHMVALPPTAIELIERALAIRIGENGASSPFVFPSPWKNDKSITANPVSHGMRDVCRALKIENATTHDLRRTAASKMASERLKVSQFLIGRLLNHTTETGGAAAVTMKVYALYEYASEKRAALNAWANLLSEIVTGLQKAKEASSLEAA